MENFVNLHNHSHFSLLNALPKIKELIKKAKDSEMSSLALTDNGNLYGAIDFYKECKKQNIKPIIGLHAYVAMRSRFDKQTGIDNSRTRIILLAKGEKGYKNLIKLVSLSHLEGFYYKPRIDKELIEKYSEDLICISPIFNSEISLALKNNNIEKSIEIINWYKNIFGSENFFLQISRHSELKGHEEFVEKIIKLSKETDSEIVASQEVYYLNSEDDKIRETLMAIQTNSEIRDKEEKADFSFINNKKALKLFKDTPEATENSVKIANMCNLELELGKWVFPKFELPDGSDSYDDALRKMVYDGIEKRKLEKTKEIEERIEYELNIIKSKGYSVYFLIVGDLLSYAHKNNILTTIRGSVAGSLITYLAGITNLNPIEYELRFERFLNPDRPSAPDIDMDFADNRRDEVIEYARKKYGENKVAQIGTFGTMMARGSIRDVARALGFPYGLGDKIAKMIPFGSQGFPMTIKRALEMEPDLKKIYKEDEDVKKIIDTAKKIEGCARHISVHAAGVVISPTDLTDFTPLQYDPKGGGKIITQYDMHAIEDAGLIKFDFLGIKNLSILSNAVNLTKKIYGIDIDIENVPVDDKKTFELLARGETAGVFQLNGQGVTRYLKELKPEKIQDINAMVALYRPGPMEFIPEYIKRKNNPQLIKYPHESMKDILEKSYGLLIYQEDVMMTAIKLAGYSWLDADKFRKAMGKKIPELMKEQEEKFKEGCIKNSIPKSTTDDLWERIKPFALYAFNKSHAASYGRVAYQTAYMKANFPVVYMSAILTADSGDVEKISEIIHECERMGIEVLPPNINESFGEFTVVRSEKERIRFGLNTIKNFGEVIANSIIKEREENGKFTSLGNFLTRIKDRNLNKKSLEALIKCGAMDEFEERGKMIENIENILYFNKEIQKEDSDQENLFGSSSFSILEPNLSESEPAQMKDKLRWEKELLGLYISGHPLDEFKEKTKKIKNDIKTIKEKSKEGMDVLVLGIIDEVKTIIVKGNKRMAFMKLSDYSTSIEVVIFPKTYEEYRDILNQENCVVIKGKISHRNGDVSLIADSIKIL